MQQRVSLQRIQLQLKTLLPGLFWILCATLKPLISLFDYVIHLTLCAVLATDCRKKTELCAL